MKSVKAEGILLVSYRPLCATPAGRKAVEDFGMSPYVDGSCRREPDLENPWPSITALCRADKLAPRLQVGHRIAYVTTAGEYGEAKRHWRLTALLEVVHRSPTHELAADWYSKKGLPIPRNCMIRGNEPLPLELTDRRFPPEITAKNPKEIVRFWDARYKKRARTHSMLLSCQAPFCELKDPPRIWEKDWIKWHKRVPGTRTPPWIPGRLWDQLQDHAQRWRLARGQP